MADEPVAQTNQPSVMIVLPLVLAQFIASYASSNMNVAISNIAADIGTTVIGVQTAITLFTLVMAALMIPGSKLTDIWGRKFYLMLGLFALGLGVGVMLTSSVNVVQASFPEKDQGEISGVPRSVSNFGSSFGTSIVGSVLVSSLIEGNKHFALALLVMLIIGVIGLLVALALPKVRPGATVATPGAV